MVGCQGTNHCHYLLLTAGEQSGVNDVLPFLQPWKTSSSAFSASRLPAIAGASPGTAHTPHQSPPCSARRRTTGGVLYPALPNSSCRIKVIVAPKMRRDRIAASISAARRAGRSGTQWHLDLDRYGGIHRKPGAFWESDTDPPGHRRFVLGDDRLDGRRVYVHAPHDEHVVGTAPDSQLEARPAADTLDVGYFDDVSAAEPDDGHGLAHERCVHHLAYGTLLDLDRDFGVGVDQLGPHVALTAKVHAIFR